MSFAVTFTGQRKDQNISVATLAEAVARVRQLGVRQFPASIWEIFESPDRGAGRLVRKFPARPAD
jgi:hypothetical protein